MKKTKKQLVIRNKVLMISLVVVIGLVAVGASANQSFKQLLADAVASIIAPEIVADLDLSEPDEVLGAFSGTDVYYPVQFHEGTYTTMHQDVAFPASSTLNVVTDGQAQDGIASFYASRDLICDEIWLDIKTAIGTSASNYSFSAGTTTVTGSSYAATNTDSLIASTTVELTDNSENLGMFALSNKVNPGTAYAVTTNGGNFSSSTLMVIKSGETILFNYKSMNATSSDGFRENDAKATAHANCYTRS